MVGIIKQLADNPLEKADAPVFTEEELNSLAKTDIKTVELEKTMYRIKRLLQMCFGEMGAVIIDKQFGKGEGMLEIMIPGHRRNVIFCVIKLQNFIPITEILQEESVQFLNNIITILHGCCRKWDGSANKTEGEKFVLTWQLPHIDDGQDNDKNGTLLEERTELADKSLITAVKIVSEIRRAAHINSLWKRPEFIAKFGNGNKCYLTFALQMGWTIEGAIGSDSKIDACYISPHLTATYRIQDLCDYYDQQILVSDSLYNMMSLKARNTLRKIDVIVLKENKDGPLGIFTFDISFNSSQ